MVALHFLLTGAAVLLLVPVTVLLIEILVAVTDRGAAAMTRIDRPPIAVIMPAHDEEAVIAGTLRAVKPQLGKSDRLIVVADNCSDNTAALAAAEGAEVVVRHDPVRRGKGYALEYGIRHLASAPAEVVVIIDADCYTDSSSLDRLAGTSKRSGRPVQALYLMHPPGDAGLLTRIAAFALIVKNQVRPSGLHRLGLPCQLMGTGMAFPWACISRAQLATGHIVEDLKLGIELALAGMPPLFCPQASVSSLFPHSLQGLRHQRTRWEHGHLGVVLQDAPRLLLHAVAARNVGLIALGLDLCVPPLALLLLLVGALWVAGVLLHLGTGATLPLALSTAAMLLLAVSVLLSWSRYGRRLLSLGELAWASLYALWKIPMYARFILARQSDWVRSKRD